MLKQGSSVEVSCNRAGRFSSCRSRDCLFATSPLAVRLFNRLILIRSGGVCNIDIDALVAVSARHRRHAATLPTTNAAAPPAIASPALHPCTETPSAVGNTAFDAKAPNRRTGIDLVLREKKCRSNGIIKTYRHTVKKVASHKTKKQKPTRSFKNFFLSASE